MFNFRHCVMMTYNGFVDLPQIYCQTRFFGFTLHYMNRADPTTFGTAFNNFHGQHFFNLVFTPTLNCIGGNTFFLGNRRCIWVNLYIVAKFLDVFEIFAKQLRINNEYLDCLHCVCRISGARFSWGVQYVYCGID